MSKLIILPFAAAAAAAAAPVIAVAAAVKKVSDAWSALSPEEKSYLLPFGASKERLRLEQASVTHHPMDGIEFAGTLPNFDEWRDAEEPVFLPQPESLPTLSFQQDEVLKSITPIVEEAGFKVQRRALPDGDNIAVFDLFEKHAPSEPKPTLFGGRHGYKTDQVLRNR
jgi:hypothetical protein